MTEFFLMKWIYERMVYTKKACKLVSESLKGVEVSICFPLEYKTAVLVNELSEIVELKVCRFDEPTTKDEAVRWLGDKGVKIKDKEECLDSPYFLDCVATLSRKALKRKRSVEGVIELTRSGVDRLRELESSGVFKKAISVDDSEIKGKGENIYGTGLGLLDALTRLNIQLPGKRVFIIGFGRVGEGCASLLKKIGCEVEVFDKDELKCMLAEYKGFKVSEPETSLGNADIIVTATGSDSVINSSNISFIKNGAILCNMGAGRHEIDLRGLTDYEKEDLGIVSKFSGKNYFYVMANGRPVNLAVGNGTPLEIMDKTFALVVFALDYLVNQDFSGIISTPKEVEYKLANLVSLNKP
ncbi:MAG: hypothetical protein H0Z28_03050 [Archaeoglobus sp.]|nr:hypothetical protein [Archaeoglobus sp.]